MTRDPEVLKVECTLAIAKCLEADPEVIDPFGLACGMFFAAVDTMVAEPRELADVEAELLRVRERAALSRLPQAPRPRRVPNFSGEGHAHHRPGTDPSTPARRKSDAEAAVLAADLEAEAERARQAQRDRERQQRAAANQHPWE